MMSIAFFVCCFSNVSFTYRRGGAYPTEVEFNNSEEAQHASVFSYKESWTTVAAMHRTLLDVQKNDLSYCAPFSSEAGAAAHLHGGDAHYDDGKHWIFVVDTAVLSAHESQSVLRERFLPALAALDESEASKINCVTNEEPLIFPILLRSGFWAKDFLTLLIGIHKIFFVLLKFILFSIHFYFFFFYFLFFLFLYERFASDATRYYWR